MRVALCFLFCNVNSMFAFELDMQQLGVKGAIFEMCEIECDDISMIIPSHTLTT